MQEVWKLMSEAGVHFVEIDQCETGTVPPSRGDDGKEEPIRSHSGFLTNSEETAESLGVFRFRNWDEDDPKLLTSIFEGLIKQMETDAKRGEGEWKICAMDIVVHVDEDAVDAARSSHRTPVGSSDHTTSPTCVYHLQCWGAPAFDLPHLPQQQHAASNTALPDQQHDRTKCNACVNSASPPAHPVRWRSVVKTRSTREEVRAEKFGGNRHHNWSADTKAVLGTGQVNITRALRWAAEQLR